MSEEKIKQNCSTCKYYSWNEYTGEEYCTKFNTSDLLENIDTDYHTCENWLFHNPEYYFEQLQAAKEENKLLTQQNKQMREALENVKSAITECNSYADLCSEGCSMFTGHGANDCKRDEFILDTCDQALKGGE